MSPSERAIVEHVRAHTADALALLERAVNVNSGTMNLAGVREVGRLFGGELESLGFKRDGWTAPPSNAPVTSSRSIPRPVRASF